MIAPILALLSGLAVQSAAAPVADNRIPPRYNKTLGGHYLFAQNNDVITGATASIPMQAINGLIVADWNHPLRTCPSTANCANYNSAGSANYTTFYLDPSNGSSLQLWTGGPHKQIVYIGRDLRMHYTQPGEPVPAGANSTAFDFGIQDSTGNLPGPGAIFIRGHITPAGKQPVYYRDTGRCAVNIPENKTGGLDQYNGQPGVGPFFIIGKVVPEDDQTAINGTVPKRCDAESPIFYSFSGNRNLSSGFTHTNPDYPGAYNYA